MKVLIACEFSGIVRDAFIAKGHDAMSCDLLPTERPGPHYQGDVRDILGDGWDMMIAHPPCTYLSHAGARWLYPKGILNQVRYEQGCNARGFFLFLLNAPIAKICAENPKPSPIFELPKHTQIIQPWMFGDEAQKTTLLWLKNLPNLKSTNIVGRGEFITYKSGKRKAKWFMDAAHSKTPRERAKIRSTTFQGIADAMADQWGANE